MTHISITSLPYETIHPTHLDAAKPITACAECKELRSQHEAQLNADIDQKREDFYHNHGRKR